MRRLGSARRVGPAGETERAGWADPAALGSTAVRILTAVAIGALMLAAGVTSVALLLLVIITVLAVDARNLCSLKNFFLAYTVCVFGIGGGVLHLTRSAIYGDILAYLLAFLAGYAVASLPAAPDLGRRLGMRSPAGKGPLNLFVLEHAMMALIALNLLFLAFQFLKYGVVGYYQGQGLLDQALTYGKASAAGGFEQIVRFALSDSAIALVILYVRGCFEVSSPVRYRFAVALFVALPILSLSRFNAVVGAVTLLALYACDRRVNRRASFDPFGLGRPALASRLVVAGRSAVAGGPALAGRLVVVGRSGMAGRLVFAGRPALAGRSEVAEVAEVAALSAGPSQSAVPGLPDVMAAREAPGGSAPTVPSRLAARAGNTPRPLNKGALVMLGLVLAIATAAFVASIRGGFANKSGAVGSAPDTVAMFTSELSPVQAYGDIRANIGVLGHPHGRTIVLPLLLKVVPRAWYPNKPLNSGSYYMSTLRPGEWEAGYALPPTFFGDAFLSFGFGGALAACVLLGLLAARLDAAFKQVILNRLPWFLLIFANFFALLRDPLSESLAGIALTAIVWAAANRVFRVHTPAGAHS